MNLQEVEFKTILERQGPRLYCKNLISAELESQVLKFLGNCWRFDLRSRELKPLMAKARRRLVFGAHEVEKYASLGRLSAVIVAKDWNDAALERFGDIPHVYACTRKQLANLLLVPSARVSVVGIFHFDGVEQEWKTLQELTCNLRQRWILSMQEYKDYVNSFGESVTWLCAFYGHEECLIPTKISRVNLVYFLNGMTPLAIAAEHGHFEIVKRLSEAGADETISDFALNFPIHHSKTLEIFEFFKFTEKRNAAGHTPLEAALLKGHLDIVKAKISGSVDFNRLFLLSCSLKQPQMVEFIVKTGKINTEQFLIGIKTSVMHDAYEVFKYLGGLLKWGGVYTEEILGLAQERNSNAGIVRKLLQLKNRVSC